MREFRASVSMMTWVLSQIIRIDTILHLNESLFTECTSANSEDKVRKAAEFSVVRLDCAFHAASCKRDSSSTNTSSNSAAKILATVSSSLTLFVASSMKECGFR